jgi:hypothetical protein
MRGIAIAALMIAVAPASAAPIDFECDVPPNRFSSVDQPFNAAPVTLAGKVSLVLARKGNYRALAGARLSSADAANSIGFQIIGDGKPDGGFSIVMNSKRAGAAKRSEIGALPNAVPDLAFAISLAPDGKAEVRVGDHVGRAALDPIAAGKGRVFCSSGQFGFAGVELR